MSETMVAYHGKPALKAAVLRQIRAHQKADRIIRGTYGKLGRRGEFRGGCAVGCTLESLRQIEKLPTIARWDHALYERYLGIPRVLARLEERIFEWLPLDDALGWPARFTAAITPGADLSMVWPRFALDLLTAVDSAVVVQGSKHEKVQGAITECAALYRRWVDGDKPSVSEWQKARAEADAAYAAAAAAADDDAAYAAYAVSAAAYAVSAAAHSAAAASAVYAADASARRNERRRQADVLVLLLKSAPIVKAPKGCVR